MIGGRSGEATVRAAEQLSAGREAGRVFGQACDVTKPAEVESLWGASQSRFGKVDIWINNAGHAGDMAMVWEHSAEAAQAVVASNVLGVIHGSQTAMRGMLAQGFGAIYNMEGMGSDGRKHAGLTFYGTTKAAIHYFTEGLVLEAKDAPVIVGGLRPGMVATDMIRDRYKGRPEEWERAKRIFNIIAEPVEVVSPWLADRMLANTKNGAIISFSNPLRLSGKFVRSLFVKREVFS